MEKDPPAGQTTGVLTELAKFYKTLLPKPSTTITFLDRNDFYTLMGQDAVLVSKKISHNSPKELRLSPDATIEYVHANKTQFESAVRELLLSRTRRLLVTYHSLRTSCSHLLLTPLSCLEWQRYQLQMLTTTFMWAWPWPIRPPGSSPSLNSLTTTGLLTLSQCGAVQCQRGTDSIWGHNSTSCEEYSTAFQLLAN
ncbi:hypothetical protein EB796_024487 [Bugula neritina]|uniref:DNA mismatch repair protein MutS-like N-terminal domain-containing protein n=1 Tax=Bugula neritina TaxID=10212 RepID=A0A7J7ITG1_BUGNE|nr:hypothetical protein EB796_024487 [Bugula neritina]